MIKCNLAVLLAERNLKISELSKRTGISRTTITALAQNQSKGIQFDTFDTLCNFLKVSPNELFTQEKFEYDFSIVELNNGKSEYNFNLQIFSELVYKTQNHKTDIHCEAELYTGNTEPDTIAVKIHYPDDITEIFKSIPVIFRTSFEAELLDCIKAEMVVRCNLEEDVHIHSW